MILGRTDTSPEDIAGMQAALGILTSRGGMTSHAAVVARGMGRPCVSGASALSIDMASRTARIAGLTQGGEAQGHDFSKQVTPTLTRAQVVAEATEARNLGLTQGGEVQRFATANENARITRAGQMALSSNVASR